jgi:hypothetical protein
MKTEEVLVFMYTEREEKSVANTTVSAGGGGGGANYIKSKKVLSSHLFLFHVLHIYVEDSTYINPCVLKDLYYESASNVCMFEVLSQDCFF